MTPGLRAVVVSGLSGSGKSTALRVLEDLGFYCIDNLPVALMPRFLELWESSREDVGRVALGIDVRERRFLHEVPRVFDELRAGGVQLEVLYLEASDDVLEIGANRAIDLIVARESAGPGRGRFGGGATPPGRALGDHPDGGPVTVRPGRFGPYVNHGKLNATLPKGLDPDTVTLDEALALLAAKGAAGGGKKTARRGAASGKAKMPSSKAKAATSKTAKAAPKGKAGSKAKVPTKSATSARARPSSKAKANTRTAKTSRTEAAE